MKQPEKQLRPTQHIRICLMIVVMLGAIWLPAGCQSDATKPLPSETPGQTNSEPEPSESGVPEPTEDTRPDQPGGTLRLWQLAAADLNPLLAADQTQRAVNDLIYEGLFRIKADASLQPQLVREMSDPMEQTSVVLSLQPGQRFHNGRAITAEDVAACLRFILNHPDQSPYADGLRQVQTIEVETPTRLRLELSSPDPWLAYALTFPVIPSDWLSQPDLQQIPGSGPFRMHQVREDGTIDLRLDQLTFDSSELRKIEVRQYSDLQDALTAFANDDIDIVILPDHVYTQYSHRSSLRFTPFAGPDMILAHLQSERGVLADNEGAFLYLKKLLVDLPSGDIDSRTLTRAIPLASGFQLAPGDVPSIADIINQMLAETAPGFVWEDSEQPIRLIWPEHDQLRTELAALIGERLELSGISWEGQPLSPDAFASAWRNSRYDLALIAARMPDAPEPSWLYLYNGQPPTAGTAENLEASAGTTENMEPISGTIENIKASTGLAGIDVWLDLLEDVWHLRSPENQMPDRELGLLLHHLAARSDWQALLIREQALLFGDRVIGSSRPNYYHPYEGIEELWVWSSPLSSSS